MPETSEHKGFAILIKSSRAVRTFEPLKGESIRILDKSGKEVWKIDLPVGIGDPGIICCEVQIDLLTERAFGDFCTGTWNRPPLKPR